MSDGSKRSGKRSRKATGNAVCGGVGVGSCDVDCKLYNNLLLYFYLVKER